MVNWDALATQVAKELGPGATVVRGPTGAARFVLEALSQEDTEALGPTCRTQTPGSEDTGPTCKAQARLGSQTTPTRSPTTARQGRQVERTFAPVIPAEVPKIPVGLLTDPATDPGCRSRPGRAACIRRCHASASDSHGPRPHRGRRVLSGQGPLHLRTFPRPSLAILRGRFHPRPVQKRDSGARVGRCYECAADLRAAGDGVSSPWSSTSKASGWSCRARPSMRTSGRREG